MMNNSPISGDKPTSFLQIRIFPSMYLVIVVLLYMSLIRIFPFLITGIIGSRFITR